MRSSFGILPSTLCRCKHIIYHRICFGFQEVNITSENHPKGNTIGYLQFIFIVQLNLGQRLLKTANGNRKQLRLLRSPQHGLIAKTSLG
jgi:hypothetical protein